MSKEITVRGTGNLRVAPDTVRAEIRIRQNCPEVRGAVEGADRRLGQLKKELAALGFAEKEIQTGSYDVSPVYSWDNMGNRKSEGFCCSHCLTVTFPLSQERMTGMLNALAGSEADPEFDLCFTLKEPEAVRRTALERAAANARDKAEILCNACGAKLGELKNISYGVAAVELISPTSVNYGAMRSKMCEDACAAEEPMIPADIEVQDDAVFTWEIDG